MAEGLDEFGAVHHKGLVEFIQHLSDFAQQRIEQTQHPYQQIRDRTHPGGQMGLLEEEGEHLARGQMPARWATITSSAIFARTPPLRVVGWKGSASGMEPETGPYR